MITFALRIVNQLVLGKYLKLNIVTAANGVPAFDVAFRAWPIDLDTYFHINNSCYFRTAELSRWRIFPQSNMLSILAKKGAMFLVAEQTIKYMRPIGPFQKYVVRTSMSTTDNKWMNYKHTFKQHPDDVKSDKEPITYAVIDVKAVLKEKTGKTMKPDEFLAICNPLYKDMFTKDDTKAKDI
eukprot:CAMPEP_0184973416 /NCGR_PEP_ID=MMETSP1098-20130426/5210_1 /TAXON_ID=89044 /ORGANISM="Spumella elongata, Strain CCAP 955/1" /LENGTH=181 /DNA_ID=CAMNT_0027495871 /DNA_START=37 /DNA_END=582 /DNA_ORIENTATION=-